jgi:RNase P/RNase MRP subunit p30
VYDATHGNPAWSAAGLIPGVGALAKGARAYKAGVKFIAAEKNLAGYVAGVGSRASKLKNLVRPVRVARTNKNLLDAAAKPWQKWANRFGVADVFVTLGVKQYEAYKDFQEYKRTNMRNGRTIL